MSSLAHAQSDRLPGHQASRTLAAQLPPLSAYRQNVHSQFGEDGVIAEIMRRLGMDEATLGRRLWCVEFGAWDGKHLSNTWHLIESRRAQAVLIEACPQRSAELVQNVRAHEGVLALQRMVGWEGPDALRAILRSTPIPERFDLLSIDIDGHDWFVWESLEGYRPTIVVIEFNPTMPFGQVIIPPRDPKVRWGASLAAMRLLGERKGYELAAVTEVNAIFVVRERFGALRLGDTSIKTLTEGLTDFRTFMFQTMDGHVRTCGNRMTMWHQSHFVDARMQPLPRWLRTHPESLGAVGRMLLSLHRKRAHRLYRKQRRWMNQ
jgi:hypothetical protein